MRTFSDVIQEVNDAPFPAYDPRIAVAMDPSQYNAYVVNDGHKYYVWLNRLVHLLQPRKVLELGTSIGRSSLFMMCALPPESSLTTVDIGSYRRGDLAPFENDPRLHIIYGDDCDPGVAEIVGTGFDMWFWDTEHTFEQLSKEWAIYQHKLVDGCIVVMDDIHLNEGMDKFWNEIKYEKIDLGTNLHFSGFGVFQYRK